MGKVQNGAVLRPLRALLNAGPVSGLSDGQLLERFMGSDGEAAELAFAAIVDRHGPMVRRICRQMLGNLHDAQDAFQATFFILARKAHSVHTRDSVASWLHGVAYRVCLRARSATSRRRAHERMAATLAGSGTSGFNARENSDWGELLHAELARLPERFRAPILLCDLEGVAYEEAARLLGCPVGTVKSRLARGRARLRVRLARRGLGPTAGMPAVPAVKASLPSTLRDATARAAIRLTMHGPPAVETVSTMAAALTEGMLRSMIVFRLKITAVVLALTALGSTAMGVFPGSGPGDQPTTAPGHNARMYAKLLPARPRVENLPEGPISKIEFEGNATITADKIKPMLLSRVGQPLDQDRIEADLKTLMATKWFSDVRYYLDESPTKSGKWALIFVVREMPLLTKVEFRGRKAIRLKEIEDTTNLKAGNRADPMRARLAVSQIQRLYTEKGYDLASVTLLEGGNSGDSKIVIEIFEGPKIKVNSISFVGNHFASDAQLRIKIATRKPILGLVGQSPGDVLDEDRKKLIEYYQSQGFFEAKVTPVTRPGAEPGKLDLTFVVSEGTRYKVRNVVIEGNTKLKTEKLREDLELHSGKPFMEAVREADKNRMLIKYGEIGYIDVQIACEPRFTNEVGVVDLLYKIEENGPFFFSESLLRADDSSKKTPAPIISAIRFQGNDTVPSAHIFGEIATRAGQPLDRNRLQADVGNLLKTLRFSDVKMHYQEKPPGSGQYVVTFFFRAMPQTISEIDYRGRKSIPLKEIEYTTGLKAGQPADRVRTALAVNQIKRLYLERGYVLATVTPHIEGYPGDLKVAIEIFEGRNHDCARSLLRPTILPATELTMMLSKITNTRPETDDAPTSHFIEERQNPIPYDLIEEDERKMTDYYRSQGFYDCRIQSNFRGANPAELQLIYHVDEGYRYKLRNVSFVGNKRLSDEAIRKGLPLESGRPLRPAMIEEAKKAIIDKYRAIGYKNAAVIITVNPADKLDLIFEIDEATP